ncbi:MAG TPA: dienelactone hydrolase family protein [Gemmatimonadaceae bacterium]|nr:dienelactone hydrolase family protein [Gemmatimonadaceae bacterium]
MRNSMMRQASVVTGILALAGCTTTRVGSGDDHSPESHASTPAASAVAASNATATATTSIPAGAQTATARLAASTRHGEYVMIKSGSDSLRAWVVYPERKTKAPVVVVVHEIFGLSDWVRGVADQLAADGFIAIAPDFLTMKEIPAGPDSIRARAISTTIRTLETAFVQRQIEAAARYAMALPAAEQKYGVVGFCWGGSASFQHAIHSASLGASVVYYGASPPAASLASAKAPVLGLYGSNDARVNATIAPADTAMRALGKTYTYHIYEGAGHGFLRQQNAANGANALAAQQAWPATIAWFRRYLGA